PKGAILDRLVREQRGYSARAQLYFTRTFGNQHQVNAIGGYETKSLRTSRNTNRLYGYDDEVTTHALVDYTTIYRKYRNMSFQGRIPSGTNSAWTRDEFASWYANVGYTYAKRY